MNQIVPFNFESTTLRVVTGDNGEPLFVGKDLCEALGYANHNDAIKQHCRGVAKRYPIVDSLGRTQEARVLTEADMFRLIVNSNLPAAERFEAWVFEEVLPSIRKTGSYTAKPARAVPSEAFKLLPMVVRAARALGLDRNAAAISANQVVAKMTGTNVMQLLGNTHLDAEVQALVFTPSELGSRWAASVGAGQHALAEAGCKPRKASTGHRCHRLRASTGCWTPASATATEP